MSVRELVARPRNIALAWRRYANHRGMWSSGLPMCVVSREPVEPVLQLALDLQQGRYRPQSPLRIPIRKADGSSREIWVYPLRDRVAQRAVLNVLQQRTDHAMAPGSFGFRPGRGVAAALASARDWISRGHWWVADADVERCFDSIPRARLLAEVQARTGDPDAAELVAQCLGWCTPANLAGVGIPQGACLAPWLCNVYLWRLDDALQSAHIPMVRYADDFVALAPTRRQAVDALDLSRASLRSLELRLHPTKTRVLNAAAPFQFLGQRLGATLPLPAPTPRAG